MRRAPSSSRGVALVEALVAILILSIGLLGMVGLQTAAVRFEQNGWIRAAVATSMSNWSDRMRANPGAGSAAYTYTQPYAAERTLVSTNPASLAPTKDCLTVICTPAELGAYDMAIWRSELNQRMPSAAPYVTGDWAGGYSVTIGWADRSWVDDFGDLLESKQCTAAMTGVDARNCCPTAFNTPPGVRCVTFAVFR